MASKKQIAIVATALSFIPPSVIANAEEIYVCPPTKQLNKCEKALKDAAIIWESRAEEARISFHGCLDKLQTRTATIVNTLVLPKQNEQDAQHPTHILLLGTTVSFVVGAAVTLLAMLVVQ